MEISRVAVDSVYKWAVITRRNVPDFPPFRVDHFDTREQAFSYYYGVVPSTPLISLGEKSPNPPINLEEYKCWLKLSKLTDINLDIK